MHDRRVVGVGKGEGEVREMKRKRTRVVKSGRRSCSLRYTLGTQALHKGGDSPGQAEKKKKTGQERDL